MAQFALKGMKLGAHARSLILVIVGFSLAAVASAEPWAGPGDTRLRNDLQLLNDSGVIDIPLTAWPMAWGDVYSGLSDISLGGMSSDVRAAYSRVRRLARDEIGDGSVIFEFSASGADNPRILRSFEDTPRSESASHSTCARPMPTTRSTATNTARMVPTWAWYSATGCCPRVGWNAGGGRAATPA
jgi:hypothetical protein